MGEATKGRANRFLRQLLEHPIEGTRNPDPASIAKRIAHIFATVAAGCAALGELANVQESEARNMRNSRFKLPRCRQPLTCLCTVFLFLLSLGAGEARTPRYLQIKIIKGKTLAGHPYMGGGISADEQRAMEREAKSYNLKLVFTRPAGTPVAPALVMSATRTAVSSTKSCRAGRGFISNCRRPAGTQSWRASIGTSCS
jgi:hypothetical protein